MSETEVKLFLCDGMYGYIHLPQIALRLPHSGESKDFRSEDIV